MANYNLYQQINGEDMTQPAQYDWVEDESHGRKRKVDKDGFVCPSTPDIPRSSAHYPDREVMVTLVNEETTEAFSEDTYDIDETETPNFQQTIDEKGAAGLNTDLETVVKNSVENFYSLINHWSAIFRKSEEVETLGAQKLDQYITAAEGVNKDLNHQRTTLYHRLTNIRNTLQVKPEQ